MFQNFISIFLNFEEREREWERERERDRDKEREKQTDREILLCGCVCYRSFGIDGVLPYSVVNTSPPSKGMFSRLGLFHFYSLRLPLE